VRDVEKRLRKIHRRQVDVWMQKTLALWSEIEEKTQNRESLSKFLINFLLKESKIFRISEWGVGLINIQKLNSLETNDVFFCKIATIRASKYENLLKAFSNDHIPHERNLFKEELLLYHKYEKKFY
jgi:hypothetical protein